MNNGIINWRYIVEFKTHEDKKAYVQDVFSHIAKHYDMMNTLLSFNQDARWRRFAIEQLELTEGMRLADIACGTCMLTKTALQEIPSLHVEGLDFSSEMLAVGQNRLEKEGYTDRVTLTQGDAMDLPYESNSFDGAVSGFALRNVPSIEQTIREMKRVVKPGGKVVTLELAKPTMFGFKQAYYLYFEKILPVLGKLSRDQSSYAWLPESLRRYVGQEGVLQIFKDVGLQDAKYFELTGGSVAVHVGTVSEE